MGKLTLNPHIRERKDKPMTLPSFPESADLGSLQAYVSAVCAARGWDQSSDTEIFLYFTEEVGELAKAIRKRKNWYAEAGKPEKPDNLEEEFADVLSYLLDLANRMGVDVEKAFREKEEKNRERTWL